MPGRVVVAAASPTHPSRAVIILKENTRDRDVWAGGQIDNPVIAPRSSIQQPPHTNLATAATHILQKKYPAHLVSGARFRPVGAVAAGALSITN